MKTIGKILWIGAGILLFFFWASTMYQWLGILGLILAVVLSPGVIVFPVIYWVVEGQFPVVYFLLLGVSAVGACLARWGRK